MPLELELYDTQLCFALLTRVLHYNQLISFHQLLYPALLAAASFDDPSFSFLLLSSEDSQHIQRNLRYSQQWMTEWMNE